MTTNPGNTVLVTYDVPSKVHNLGAVHAMRAHGFLPIQLSVWVGRLSAVNALPLDEWREKGVKVEVIQFAAHEFETVRRLALAAMAKDASELRAFVDKQLSRAEDHFAQGERLASATETKRGRSILRSMIRQARRRINGAKQAGLLFDLMGDAATLFDAVGSAIRAHELALAGSGRDERPLEQMELDAMLGDEFSPSKVPGVQTVLNKAVMTMAPDWKQQVGFDDDDNPRPVKGTAAAADAWEDNRE